MNEFPVPTAGSGPFSIALGPDGNVWFTEVNSNKIGRVTPAGVVTEFTAPGRPGGITAGPDGALWFTEVGGNKIGRMTTDGTVTNEYTIPTPNTVPHRITTGPDGALWFAEAGADKIGRIATDGTITEFAIPAPAGRTPFDIVSGPDGNLWFTEIHSNKVGKITTGGAITEFTVGDHPSMITAGPDGALWFSESDTEQANNPNKIGRITTGGSFTEFAPPTNGSKPQGITTGPDGALWFTEAAANKIGRVTTDGHFSEFAIPTSNSIPFSIVTGSDGNLWFGEFSGNKVGQVVAQDPASYVTLVFGDDNSNTLQGSAGADLIYGYDPNGPQSQAGSIAATRVAAGLSQPLFAGAPPGDTSRLFVVEKTGLIKILDLATGQVLATPFLDVSGQISTAGERGLLGLAFDPNYATNGFFYVDLINPAGDAEIRRYHVSSNPNVADAASVTPVITIDQTAATNHKAGWLGFGPDGYLYNSSGDGGSTPTAAQDIDSLLGKILRIDVHADGFPADPSRNYAVPADNPFVGTAGADEIYALGLRNPWRPSFDRATGDFYIADVGNTQYEEIDIGQKGANYGWPVFEGPAVLFGGTPTGGSAVPPIHFYDHSVGQSITGGYVYRGEGEALQGQYFYADFVQGKIFTLQLAGGSWVATDRTSQIITDAGAVTNPTSFGEDARGNLYLTDFDGEVFRLTPMVVSADQADVLHGLAGNDMLFGGSGNDTLDGGPGADVMLGGAGTDTADYSSSSAGVTVNLTTGVGAGGDAQGDVLGGIENVIGSAQADTLTGDANANTLDGGGGADVMAGGAGNDTYIVDHPGDMVIENAGQGTDTVLSTAHLVLPANVENLTLTGSADLQGYGNGDTNTLTGNAGSNLLDGRGGVDVMLGGAGNDVYVVDNAGDQVVENLGEGNDAVFSTAHLVLPANVEALVLQGSADLQGYGNSLANALFGNSGSNLLDGRGGADVMLGGAGNDVIRKRGA
jgi:streptogramin lyase/Ca2+-binding RTX toxin-like protein